MNNNDWNKHVDHPLQTWEWGEFRNEMGITVVRKNNWQCTFHRVPHTTWTIGYFPKGPMPDGKMIRELTEIGKQNHAIYIQLEPKEVFDVTKLRSDDDINLKHRNIASSSPHNLIPSHHPLFTKYTFILDLTKSEEELLKEMHSKTRYNLRVAEKHGVVIKNDNSDEAFEQYLRLEKETTNRQEFFAHNETYHRRMWNSMKKTGIAQLWTASYKETVLVAWILFVFKDTIYYPYGASSRDHREVMAPNLLLWKIAKWGKTNGYKKFDLWGALGPTPDPNDPWYGFHRFKEGYHPNLVEYIGSFDLIINPILYQLYVFADMIRWKILKFKH